MKKYLPKQNLIQFLVAVSALLISLAPGKSNAQCTITPSGCPADIIACADSINDDGDAGKFVTWSSPGFTLDCGGAGGEQFYMSFDLPESHLAAQCWEFNGVQRTANSADGWVRLWQSSGSGDPYFITPLTYFEPNMPVSVNFNVESGEHFTWELILVHEDGGETSAGDTLVNADGEYTIATPDTAGAFYLKFLFTTDLPSISNKNTIDDIVHDGFLLDADCASGIDFTVTGPQPSGFFIIGDTTITYTATYTPTDGSDPIVETCEFDIIVEGVTVNTPTTTPESCLENDGTVTIVADSPTSGSPNLQYSIDGGAWTSFTSPVTVGELGDGEHSLNVIDSSLSESCGLVEPITFTIGEEADTEAPNAECKDTTLYLSYTGAASVTANDIDNGSTDDCGIVFYSLSQTAFTCDHVGANTVTLTVTDNAENEGTCTATITVLDTFPPVARCQPVTVQLDANGNASITAAQIDNGSSDACGISTMILSQTDFTCANVGDNTVTLTVTDNNGNSDTCDAIVTVEDNILPLAVCQDITVELDADGNASITPAQIDNGSTDNCGINTMTVAPNTFNCSNVGGNTVTLTVTDVNGNSSTCTATVTVEDNIAPEALCQDITIQLGAAGTASITAAQIDNGSNDNCGIASLSLSQTAFTCSDVGENTVTLTVTDNNGNESTCDATVTVEDNVSPIALCQSVTVQLDANGDGSTTAAEVDNGSTDICGIDTMTLSQTDFTCADIGSNTVTFTVTDVNGNTSTCSAEVTVQDTVSPDVLCQNITVYLDTDGNGSTTAAEVDNGSTDACGIDTMTLSQTDFTCANVAENTVTLTVTDNNGNESTCDATVTVADTVSPVALCQDITVQLDANGEASIVAADVNDNSSDNCAIDTLIVAPNTFDCSNVGANTVTLTVTDVNGNSSTCTATVTVEDNVAPEANCQNVTVYLDATGNGSTTAGDVDDASSDACGIDRMTLSQTDFTCTDIGSNTVTFTVTDVNGNTSTCSAEVTVQDTVSPDVLCQSVTVYLDADGNGSTTAAEVDNGSTDACGIDIMTLSQTDFTCVDVGDVPVTLTVTDNNENVSTCDATVTVEDTVPPVPICQDVTIHLDATGNGSVTAAEVDNGSNDACGIDTMTLSVTDFTCDDVGDNTVTLTVTDNNGNESTCTATVIVKDSIAPGVTPASDQTVECDGDGNTDEYDAWLAANGGATASDVCDSEIQWANNSEQQEWSGDDCNSSVTVTFTATDVNGNTNSSTATFTIADTSAPVITVPSADLTLECFNAETVALWVGTASATDSCQGDVSVTPDYTEPEGNCDQTITVTFTASDVCGNTATETKTFTINDNTGPELTLPADITVECDESIDTTNTGYATATDNCDPEPEVSFSDVNTPGECANEYTITRTWTATDICGNTSSDDQTITVEDNTAPVITLPANITVECDESIDAENTGSATATDNCDAEPEVTFSDVTTPGECTNEYTITRTWTATDACGNSSSSDQTITVEDNTAPELTLPADITIECDESIDTTNTGEATATDNCDLEPVIAFSDITTPGECPGEYTITRTWTATDACGNSSSLDQTITVEDNTAPTLKEGAQIPVGETGIHATIDEVPEGPTEEEIAALFEDNCSGVIVTKSGGLSEEDEICNWSVTYIYEISDSCGNVTEPNVEITYSGTIISDVEFEKPAANKTVKCDSEGQQTALSAWLNNHGGAVVSGADPQDVTWTNNYTGLSDGCGNTGSARVTFTATDVCGNTGSTTATFSIVDNTSPDIYILAENLTVECDGNGNTDEFKAWLENNGGARAQDNCGTITWTNQVVQFVKGCCNTETFRVRFTATDECGNSADTYGRFIIEDTTSPVFTVPEDITLYSDANCEYDTGIEVTGDVTDEADDCCAELEATFTDVTEQGQCAGEWIITRTWSLADSCGNEAENQVQIITVLDTVAPVAVCSDLTVQLDANGMATITVEDIDGGSADNCGIDSMFIDNDKFMCGNIGENEVTLTVIDECGNVSTCTATVTVEEGDADCGTQRILAEPDFLTLIYCPGGTVSGDINLLANDTGFEEGTVTMSITELPDLVNVDIISGELVYVNDDASEAVVQFVYSICHNVNTDNCDTAEVTIHVLLDSDCDGVPNIDDIDDDDDGIPDDVEEGNALNQETLDSDGDGIVDRLDIDSDNDGIVDNIEWQSTVAEGGEYEYFAPLGTDSDGDGWDDRYDDDGENIFYEAWDTDSDGKPDYLDEDTDGDGVADYIEGWDAAPHDTIADTESSGADSDKDGLDDAYDTYDTGLEWLNGQNAVGSNAPLQDMAGDTINGIRDWRDVYMPPPLPPKPPRAPRLFIPEGFSPNTDNKNDYFEIQMHEEDIENEMFGDIYPNAHLYIYNRWGNLIFEKENYGNYEVWGSSKADAWWDGSSQHSWTVGGNKVPVATYVYILLLDENTVEKGTVFINY